MPTIETPPALVEVSTDMTVLLVAGDRITTDRLVEDGLRKRCRSDTWVLPLSQKEKRLLWVSTDEIEAFVERDAPYELIVCAMDSSVRSDFLRPTSRSRRRGKRTEQRTCLALSFTAAYGICDSFAVMQYRAAALAALVSRKLDIPSLQYELQWTFPHLPAAFAPILADTAERAQGHLRGCVLQDAASLLIGIADRIGVWPLIDGTPLSSLSTTRIARLPCMHCGGRLDRVPGNGFGCRECATQLA